MTVDRSPGALADREEIRDLARGYAHCVWQNDPEGAVDLFAADGVIDLGDRPRLEGRVAMLAEYRKAFRTSAFRPFISQHVIELDGDRATGTCYVDLKAVVDGIMMVGWGYYEDEYVRVDGRWRIQTRKLNLIHYGPS
ncbi:MAG: nuclear transport factor 2 family protein, partial [Deltaproteobacteria bacterium]|nr:nuclear transport factor 2 family protein [Deltaproteobacteria bacterium]